MTVVKVGKVCYIEDRLLLNIIILINTGDRNELHMRLEIDIDYIGCFVFLMLTTPSRPRRVKFDPSEYQ